MAGLLAAPGLQNNISINDIEGIMIHEIPLTQEITPSDIGREYIRKRKISALLALDVNLVTMEELGMAQIRFQKAISQIAVNEVPPLNPNVIQAAVTRALDDAIPALTDDIHARIQATLQEELRPIKRQLLTMQAHQINERIIFKHNQRASCDDSLIIRAPLKANIGFSAEPPIATMNGTMQQPIAAVLNGDPPLPGTNAIPPEEFGFPRKFNFRLTSLKIGFLCRFYNDTFGIVDGDDRESQNFKLRNFILGI
eukprot:gene6372-12885_t